MPVRIAEQHVQDWTSDGVVRYLERRGYDVCDWHVTQNLDKRVPADWVFFDEGRLKVFGFQYKALYSNGMDYWVFDRDQHNTLRRFPWITYCASELVGPANPNDALRAARIYATDMPFRRQLPRRSGAVRYVRWPAFFRAFEACHVGHRVGSREELQELLGQLSDTGPLRDARQMLDHFFADIEGKRVLRVRSRAG